VRNSEFRTLFQGYWEIVRDTERYWEILRDTEGYWGILGFKVRTSWFQSLMQGYWGMLRDVEGYWGILRVIGDTDGEIPLKKKKEENQERMRKISEFVKRWRLGFGRYCVLGISWHLLKESMSYVRRIKKVRNLWNWRRSAKTGGSDIEQLPCVG